MLDPIYTDRIEAGRKLAWRLIARGLRQIDCVLALPRGGVPVAYEVARALDADLDVLVVRKLGVPGNDELAFGAIAHGGARVLSQETIALFDIDGATIERVTSRERADLERRALDYRGPEPLDVRGRRVCIVDDGIATGSTMRAALDTVKASGAAVVIVAAPVAPRVVVKELEGVADAVVVDEMPEPFMAVGTWYQMFRQIADEEVRALLQRHRQLRALAKQPRAGGALAGGAPSR